MARTEKINLPTEQLFKKTVLHYYNIVKNVGNLSTANSSISLPIHSDLGPLMTLSVTDSFLYQEVCDSLYLNADETAMGASKRHADLDRKRLIHMQA